MNLTPLAPKQSLNKAFRLVKLKRSDMETFKTSLLQMLSRIDEGATLKNFRRSQITFKKHVAEILAKKQNGEETGELERRIDEMVYVLYGLTEEEAEIVGKM